MKSSIAHTINGEYIREWLVLGPFFPDDLDRDFLADAGGEANIQADEGMWLKTPAGEIYTWQRYQSQWDFISLRDAMKQLLFSVDLKFQSELDCCGQPSENLRQIFEKNGIYLSQSAIITMYRRGDNRWAITDREMQQEYTIVKEENRISIYQQSKNAIAYAACDLLSSKAQCLEMALRRFGQVKVWLNGDLIHETCGRKRWEDERFQLSLKNGVNRCLIKVGQYVAGKDIQWGFWAKIEDYDTYLRSLQLRLIVKRHKPDKLTISAYSAPSSIVNNAAHPAPVSTLFKLPSLPVQIEIRDEASQLLATLQTRIDESVEWAIADSLQGALTIVARYRDALGKMQEAKFTCQVRNIISVSPKQGQWQTYDATDGLIGSCWAIMPDSKGRIWFCSQGMGVQRYDGQTFKTFTAADSLPSNHIFAIFEDSKGMMWFGTKTFGAGEGGSGVFRYDGERFETFTMKEGLIDDRVIAIYEDDRGHLWFGTLRGVSEFDGKTFHNYAPVSGLSPTAYENLVGAIAQDADGNLWFGHGIKNWLLRYGGATRYDGQSFTHFSKQDGLAQNWVTSITTDALGNVWFGTSEGVSMYDGKTFVTFTTDDGLPSNGINEVIHTKNGELWFATWDGVSRYRDGRFHNFTIKDDLASNFVNSAVADRDGNLWFSCRGGASQYDGSVESIPVDIGRKGFQDREGNLWFSISDIGLGMYDGKHIRTFAMEDGLPSNNVRHFYEDKAGNLWIGTFLSGLVKYDGEKFETFTTKDGLAYNNIEAIYEDRDGLLWIAMQSNGIYTYNGEKFVGAVSWHDLGIRVFSDNLFPADIIADGKGNLWFSTRRNGVTRYDGKTFTQFTTAEGLPHDQVYQFLVDSQGDLWMATAGGLCRYDGNEFQTFATQDSSPGNDVSCVFEDSNGSIWFGLYAGGARKFDGKNFQQFTTDDGLLSNMVFSIHENEKGQMIFLTAGGITIYTPPEEKVPPPISITEVVADKSYPMPKTLKIPSTTPRIDFAYHGVSFKTKRLRYSYILEGQDTDWQATWDEQVSYEGLEPGNYVFKVIAIDRDLNYSEPASVELEVIPDPRNHRIIQLEAHIREQELAEMERIRQELEDARQIQQSLLPEKPPEIEGFEVVGVSLPAKEVSGDFFTYLSFEKNTGIVLADVTGKSVKAAMVATLADGMLNEATKSRRELWNSPGMILRELNIGLHPRLMRSMFTAMSLGVLVPEHRRLIVSNAGMPYPIVKHGNEVWELEVNGMPLGLTDIAEYEDMAVSLQAGDFVIFCSDGVIEATDEADEMYQTERLLELIQQADPGISAQEMLNLILRDVTAFVGGEEASDDITIVVLLCKESSF